MMARLLRIEFLLGRGDKSVKKPRTVDLDILFFGDIVMKTDFLTVPHPRLHRRAFVLKPLSKLAPEFIHPILKQSVADMCAHLDDPHEIKRWRPDAGVATGMSKS
jgi:7,8-dihydro-6-hydroxymethylpterin-pyrophosphokinase